MSYDCAYRICVNKIVDNSHLHLPGRWSLISKLKAHPIRLKTLFGMCARVVSQPGNTLVVEE